MPVVATAVQQEVARLLDDPIDLPERTQLAPSPCLMNQAVTALHCIGSAVAAAECWTAEADPAAGSGVG